VKITAGKFPDENFPDEKITGEKIPDEKIPIHRKKYVGKILTGKILDEFVPIYRKNFGEKILDRNFPIGKITDEKIIDSKIPGEFVPSVQLSSNSKSGIQRRLIFVRFLVPDLIPRES